MQCSECSLRYNNRNRQPYIIDCGHTLCKQCIPSVKQCTICKQSIFKHQPNYSLQEIIDKDKKQIDKFIKICFVGSTNVGKTSLIGALKNQEFKNERITTIGYDFSFIDRKIGNIVVRFQLWDSAGQQKFRAISPIHYKNADIIMIVYDINESEQNNKVEQWIQQCYKNCDNEFIPILIGNKLDLTDGKLCKPLGQKTWQQIKKQKIIHYEISCKSKYGLDEVWKVIQKNIFNKKKKKIKMLQNNTKLIKRQINSNIRIDKSCC